MDSTNKTAILLFTRSAQQDAQHKGLPNGDFLFHALTKETLNKVKRTGLPFFHITETKQFGATFGARFVNAIEAIFIKGFDSVITIGNDSPQLKTKHLVLAQQQLELGNTVLGPSLDGGIYLMGLHKSKFNPQRFLNLPWQRSALFGSILRLLQTDALAVYKLPVLAEIDSLDDFVRLNNFVKSVPLYLLSLLDHFIFLVFCKPLRKLGKIKDSYSTVLKNKGSPISFTLA